MYIWDCVLGLVMSMDYQKANFIFITSKYLVLLVVVIFTGSVALNKVLVCFSSFIYCAL